MAPVLTLASVAVLIYFIHHIPESIGLSNVVSGIGRQLAHSINELFPENIATGNPGDKRKPSLSDLPADFYENSIPVSLPNSGYFPALDEIAQRALLPGVNDPMIAMNFMDWLETALVTVTQRDPPQRLRYNENGALRVFAHADQLEDFCNRVFDQLRHYVAVDRNAAKPMMLLINEIRDSAKNDLQRRILAEHAGRLIAEVEKSGPERIDFEELKQMDELGRKAITANRCKFDDVLA